MFLILPKVYLFYNFTHYSEWVRISIDKMFEIKRHHNKAASEIKCKFTCIIFLA